MDEMHLFVNYKYKLLMTVVIDENHNVLPIAYALVDEEMTESWE